jgi:hypothetical protein
MAGARSTRKPRARTKSPTKAEAPGVLQAIELAGVGLVLASVDDAELQILEGLAAESEHAERHGGGLPPTIRKSDGTNAPAPLYVQYLEPYKVGFASGLANFSPVLNLSEAGYRQPVLRPRDSSPQPELLRRLATGRTQSDRDELRNILVFELRRLLWVYRRISGTLVTFDDLKHVQEELRRFLDNLIAFHWGVGANKEVLGSEMSRWVVEVTNTTPFIRCGGFYPDSGELRLDPILDFRSIILASVFRLLPNYGPRGVRRCRNCEWYFHPAILLKSRLEEVDFCSDWCRAKYHSDRRPRKRQLP